MAKIPEREAWPVTPEVGEEEEKREETGGEYLEAAALQMRSRRHILATVPPNHDQAVATPNIVAASTNPPSR
jgi:hypothetical protein